MTFKKFIDLVSVCYDGDNIIDYPIMVDKPKHLTISNIEHVQQQFGVDEKLFREWLIDIFNELMSDYDNQINVIIETLNHNQKNKSDQLVKQEFDYEKRMWECFSYVTD